MTAQTVLSRVRTVMTTPPVFAEGQPRVKTNLDTNFLKLIAIISMLIDHIGGAFFPEIGWMRWVGRLAFPIFCYCMTVGLLYTNNIKKYFFRLGLFALISQPFYILAFHPYDFFAQFTNWNIFFTLFLSLLALYGVKERKWWLFALAFFVLSWWNFDYSATGVILMLIFYLCRNHPALGAVLYLLFMTPTHAHAGDPLNFMLGGLTLDWTFFTVFALPLLFLRTSVHPKIPKWFFYAFYPAHLALIAIIQFVIS